MDEFITATLAKAFTDVSYTPEITEFYQEVAADLKEAALAKMKQDSTLTAQTAVQAAYAEMGDLEAVVQLMMQGGTDDKFEELPALQTAKAYQQAFDSQHITQVQVTGTGAKVQLVQSATEQLTVTYTQRGFFKGKVAVEQAAGVVTITLPDVQPWAFMIPFKHPRQTVEIGVPTMFAGEINIISHHGVITSQQLTAPAATIMIQNKAGVVELQTTEVAAITLRTKSGNLKLTHCQTNELAFDVQSGNLQVFDVRGQMTLNLKSGNAKLQQVTGAGTFSVQSGNLTVNWQQVLGDVQLTLQNGHIKNDLPLDDAFSFDLKSQNGVVKVGRSATFTVNTLGHQAGYTALNPQYQVLGNVRSGHLRVR